MAPGSNALLAAYRRNTRLVLWLSFVLGGVALSAYFVIGDQKAKGISEGLLLLVGTVLVESAIVGLLLNRATVREQSLSTQQLVNDALTDVLVPLRPIIYADAIEDYAWNCLIAPADLHDPFPEFVRMNVEVSKTVHHLPTELRAVCVAALDETALADFVNDERYLLRWMIRPVLDPHERSVFSIENVSIDGVHIAGEYRDQGSGGCEWRGSVPRSLRLAEGTHRVFYRYVVRKRFGQDKRGTVRTQLFNTTFGASFSCAVDSRLELDSLAAYHSEVSPLAQRATPIGRFNATGSGPLSVSVQFAAPLQRGSAVSFELERS